jgi:hypothetical protein
MKKEAKLKNKFKKRIGRISRSQKIELILKSRKTQIITQRKTNHQSQMKVDLFCMNLSVLL